MKKIILLFVMMFTLSTFAFAFLYEVTILTKEEIKKLKNEELISIYTDAVIEREASETFHGKAGFTPKEYQSFKDLLGLIIHLRQEMLSRELEPPPITDWLK